MSFSRPIQWYHSHGDSIGPDGTFKWYCWKTFSRIEDTASKEVKVGRLASEQLRVGREEERLRNSSATASTAGLRVGKLNTDNLFPKVRRLPKWIY